MQIKRKDLKKIIHECVEQHKNEYKNLNFVNNILKEADDKFIGEVKNIIYENKDVDVLSNILYNKLLDEALVTNYQYFEEYLNLNSVKEVSKKKA